MSILKAGYTINGNSPLLMNNPQTVDRFNHYARSIGKINAKGRRRTDDDYLEVRDLEVASKLYWDDAIGVYVPARWVSAALAKVSFAQAKISKAAFRGGVFVEDGKLPLKYDGRKGVKEKLDVVKNEKFRHLMLLPQGQVRIAKAMPIFHNWEFSGELEFDDKIIDFDTLKGLLEYASHYGGFGDFRPTFGKADAEVVSV